MSAADPISYKGIEISTIEGRFVLFLTDFTKKNKKMHKSRYILVVTSVSNCLNNILTPPISLVHRSDVDKL